MIWRSPLAVLVLAGLLAPLCWAGLWLAGPVSAGSGVGCTGNTCSVLLSSLITLKGDAGNGTTHAAGTRASCEKPPWWATPRSYPWTMT